MSESERRKVGERGQVTIPKDLREQFGITGGDEVVFSEEDGKLVIERPVSEAELAEGYRKRAQRSRDLAAELRGVSKEANETIGDVPEW